MPRPRKNEHVPYDGSRHAPGMRANQRDFPQGDYTAMTDHMAKFQQGATMAAMDDPMVRGWGWANRVTRWNPRCFEIEPSNYLGIKEADHLERQQTYLPGGMLGQLHASKSTGDEMKTLPFERYVQLQY